MLRFPARLRIIGEKTDESGQNMIFIGVTTHSESFSELTDGEQAYVDALKRSNMTPVLIRNTSDFKTAGEKLAKLDGLVIIGGGDVHPCHYGRVLEPGIEYMDFNRDRDLFELQLARRANQLDVPTLGICRGNQVMNVSMGGTLISDLHTHHRSHSDTHQQQKPYNIPHQTVHVQPGTELFDILFGTKAHDIDDIDWVIHTNSMHHQAIEHPAPGMYVNAIASDGVYEGLEDPRRSFYIGVQWHPEYLPSCRPLFDALRDACLHPSGTSDSVQPYPAPADRVEKPSAHS